MDQIDYFDKKLKVAFTQMFLERRSQDYVDGFTAGVRFYAEFINERLERSQRERSSRAVELLKSSNLTIIQGGRSAHGKDGNDKRD